MADTQTPTKMLHRITVTVEMDTAIDPQAIIHPGAQYGPDFDPPVTGTDELEAKIQNALQVLADAELNGYVFRVTVFDQFQAFPALDLGSWA